MVSGPFHKHSVAGWPFNQNLKSEISNLKSRIPGRKPSTAVWPLKLLLLPTANCQLATGYWLLPTGYSLVPNPRSLSVHRILVMVVRFESFEESNSFSMLICSDEMI